MLNYLIKYALKNRSLVLFTYILFFILGIFIVLRLPIDVFPDLNKPTVTIMTEANGLAPEDVENLVTFPIETMMAGIPNVERVRSQSGSGLSVIYVEFKWDSNIYLNRQLVTEKIDVAKEQLPKNTTPVVTPISSIMGEIMLISVKSKTGKTSPMELRELSEWVIRPKLLNISGISQVTNIGGEVKQYQILFSPEKLTQFGVTVEEIKDAVQKSNLNSTGGFINNKYQEYLIKNNGRFNNIEELKKTVVLYRRNHPITLDEIAEVKIGAKNKRGDGSYNASPSVIMAISKQPSASTIDLTKKIDLSINQLKYSLSKDIEINTNLFRQANFINTAIHNVIEALRDGVIIVVILIFIFLLNFRITFIVLTAIPISFIISFLVFRYFGISINTMTLGGLSLAIGELVDDAIVDIENIFRRLKENSFLEEPKPILDVIYNASLEIRSSIVYATFIVIIVFIPLFFLSGIEGRLLMPLGLAYIVSLLASLIVSLTLTPVLAYFLLKKFSFNTHEKDSFLVAFLKKYDKKLLQVTLKNPNKVIVASSVLFLISLTIIPFLGREFLPPFNEGTLTINFTAKPGISLEESNKLGSVAEKLLLEVPEVISTGRRTGRAELDEHAEGVHYSEIDVDLKTSKRKRSEILDDIREKLAVLNGVSVNIGQPISHRIDHLMSGIRAQVAIKLFGDDLATLRSKGNEIKDLVEKIDGTADVQLEKQVLIPQVNFNVNREKAMTYGIKPADITETLSDSLNGFVISEAIEGQKRYEVIIRLKEELRKNLDSLNDITIANTNGIQIPVSSVVDINHFSGVNQILRENSKRRIVVMLNVSNRDLGSVVTDIKENIEKNIKLPQGYFIEYGGQFEAQQEATKNLIILSVISIASIFFILIKALGNWAFALQVMINIPLALIGAVFAILLSRNNFSVATLVGFISLIGITSRNGIMMISHYIHLMEKEGESFSEEMIIRGSIERLIPVLMTASTAGLSLIPLAISVGESGKEILQPLAVVVLGGIITSTLLDQIITPAVFYKYGKKFYERNNKT
ncbi:MAG: efflux RND transporter permease subunit [Candidatus Sericytochromatia bacterium]